MIYQGNESKSLKYGSKGSQFMHKRVYSHFGERTIYFFAKSVPFFCIFLHTCHKNKIRSNYFPKNSAKRYVLPARAPADQAGTDPAPKSDASEEQHAEPDMEIPPASEDDTAPELSEGERSV